MNGTVAPPSSSSIAALTCSSRTTSSLAMMEAKFVTAGFPESRGAHWIGASALIRNRMIFGLWENKGFDRCGRWVPQPPVTNGVKFPPREIALFERAARRDDCECVLAGGLKFAHANVMNGGGFRVAP